MSRQSLRTDVVVIGGGIAGIGFAAAWCELQQKRGEGKQILVLDQESALGYHSTGRSAATWIESYGNHCIRELNAESKLWFDDFAESKRDNWLDDRGMLLAFKDKDIDAAESLMAVSSRLTMLDHQQVAKLVPIWDTAAYKGFVYEKGAKDVNVSALHQFWIAQVKRSGSSVQGNQQVIEIGASPDKQYRWRIETKELSIDAQSIVNAAGAWADQIGQLAGAAPQGLLPCRRSAAMVEIISKETIPDTTQTIKQTIDTTGWPLFAEIDETWYAKPEGRQLMVSPADEDPITACDVSPDDEILAAGIDRFESVINAEVGRVTHKWAGLRTFAPDRTPVVGHDSAVDQFFWLAGQGGYGIQTSPALSKFAALLFSQLSNNESLEAAMSPARDMSQVNFV